MEINIYPTRDLLADPAALVARCRRLGVRNVCFSVDAFLGDSPTGQDGRRLAAFVGRLADDGIAAPVLMDSFGRDPDLVLDPTGRGAGELAAKRRMLDALHLAGVGVLLNYIHTPYPLDPADDERTWQGLANVYRTFIGWAEAADVRVANHAIWRCLPEPSPRDDALARGVTMDGFCTGMHIMGGDAPALVETFQGRIFYAQARDLRGRWPAAQEVFLGEGELDFVDILRRLDAAGYDGLIGPEHLGLPRQPGDDLEAAAVAFLHDALARARTGGGAA
jgi:sugar phosphate isomerase/epimerase